MSAFLRSVKQKILREKESGVSMCLFHSHHSLIYAARDVRSMKRFMDQSFTNMNTHAHSCQVKVIFESYSFVLMIFNVMQDGLPVLGD